MTTVLEFTIDGLAPDALRAFAVDGTEALSSLYAFDIDCLGPNGRAMDPLGLVGRRATLRIALDGAQLRSVHGIVDMVEIEPPSIFGDARYRFRLVPWLARLRLSRSNQIHGTAEPVSVPDVIEAELSGALRPTAQVSDEDLRRFEHELRLRDRGRYPRRDHVSQYEETDFAFISRLAEHAGIFYFFENDGSREKVVFADDNLFATPLEGGAGLDWKPWSAGGREAAPDTIQALRQRCAPVPQKVWLQDHNYRIPHVPLLVEAMVDSRGRGNWVEYGAHHRSPEEGTALARIRAEELRCHQSRWHGSSAVARLSPGRIITLAGHPYDGWNQSYLVVSVRHEVRVPMPGVAEADWAGYRNHFEAIDRDVPFRPARVTPVPRMDGLLNGRIDAAGDRAHAEIDDQGRYKVRVPFDLGGSPDGRASQWIRMSSPFGGDGDGMHFPLFPGTEVVIGCVNGDPDRPVILGAVPNPRNRAVVTSEHSTHNRLVTRSGMGFEMSVNPGGVGGGGGGGGGGAGIAAPSAFGPALAQPVALGAPARVAQPLATPVAEATGGDLDAAESFARFYVQRSGTEMSEVTRMGVVPAKAAVPEPADLTMPGALGYLAATSATSHAASAKGEPRTDIVFDSKPGIFTKTTASHFTRVGGDMGTRVAGEIILAAGVGGKKDMDLSATGNLRLWAGGKVQQYVAGDTEQVYHGQRYSTVHGTNSSKVYGNSISEIVGTQLVTVVGVSSNTFLGARTIFNLSATNTMNAAATFTATFGLQINITLAISLSLFMGARLDVTLAARLAMVYGWNQSFNLGGSFAQTTGAAIAGFLGNRFTNVGGMDIKIVNGLDSKHVGFSLDVKVIDLSKDEFKAEKSSVVAALDNLVAKNGNLEAQAKSLSLWM